VDKNLRTDEDWPTTRQAVEALLVEKVSKRTGRTPTRSCTRARGTDAEHRTPTCASTRLTYRLSANSGHHGVDRSDCSEADTPTRRDKDGLKVRGGARHRRSSLNVLRSPSCVMLIHVDIAAAGASSYMTS